MVEYLLLNDFYEDKKVKGGHICQRIRERVSFIPY